MRTVGELSSASRDLALHRFRLLESHLEHARPLRVIAAETGVPFRTMQRWAAQYRRFGLVALARKMRGDNGVRRAVSANLKAAIEGPGTRETSASDHLDLSSSQTVRSFHGREHAELLDYLSCRS
jgi:hypothetical protein